MRVLLMVLCIAIYALIVLDANPCSTDEMRKMLIQACAGYYRTKRGFSEPESPKHNEIQYGSRVRHPKQFKVIANDTSGGLLIRHKRGTVKTYMYCCLNIRNCTEIFPC